ncbi:MAG: hypothetical protein ACLQF2_16115 [Rhodomicrobium sp.]
MTVASVADKHGISHGSSWLTPPRRLPAHSDADMIAAVRRGEIVGALVIAHVIIVRDEDAETGFGIIPVGKVRA